MKINNIDIQFEIKVKKEKNYQLCYNFDSDRSVRKRKSNVALINRVMSFLPMVPSQFTSRQLKVKSVFPPVSSSHIGCTFVKQKQASKQAKRTSLKKAAKDECATSSVHSTLHIPMHAVDWCTLLASAVQAHRAPARGWRMEWNRVNIS